MKLLIRAAKIIDPTSSFNGKKVDILINKGKIEKISKKIDPGKTKVFEAKNLHVSPGWFDMQSNFRDPGHEYKEDINSGLKAASSGGFTSVLAMPSTFPPTDNKSAVEYLLSKASPHAVRLYPAGTLSAGLKGKEISEMYDMHRAGALAFTDDKKPVNNASLLIRAMLYVKSFDGLIISFPENESLTHTGQINEGKMNTILGLKGIPDLAESLAVSRDIYLSSYCESRLHFSLISAEESVKLIKNGKKRNKGISCGVSANNLLLDDSLLKDFDTNLKLNPPLRTKKDIRALIKGLRDNTIDVICSDHSPEDVEEKKREFDHAAFGAIGLQTAFAASRTATKGVLKLDQLIEKIAINPRKILQLEIPSVEEGNTAELSLFDPDKKWKLEEKDIRSKSYNTYLTGRELTGKALGIIAQNKFVEA